MAGRGPAPKDPSKRRRRNADPVKATTVTADGQVRGPELPADMDWPERTREWWHTWRTSPQAQAFTASDWDFLIDTAVLHSQFWQGDMKVASELRLRVAKFGATPEDRARLRIQVESDAEDAKRSGMPPKPGGRYGHLRDVSAS